MSAAGRSSALVTRLRCYLNWETGAYAVVSVMALAMRLWDLGARGVSHDESLHGIYSWYLANGSGYSHDPMMHGPFLFHGTALNFVIFGDSDVTLRLLAALLGTGLVVLPYFLRRHLGRRGALCVAALLAFSPTLLYFSRYTRNDVIMAFWALLLVVLLWRYFGEKRSRYLYMGAAVLSFAFCTKETSYITTAAFVLILLVVAARELLKRVRRGFGLKGLSPQAEYALLIGTLSLPLYSAFVQLIPNVDLPSGFHWVKMLTVAVLLGVCAAIGIRWDWRRWLLSALVFYGIFALLYTSFFTTPAGFVSGLWGSVDYWIEQQSVARGGQPWFYYFMILPVYEFLPLVFAAAGAFYYAVKGRLYSRFLIDWGLISLLAYTYSGEKMPWISVHMALPVILLGGMFIGRLWCGFGWRSFSAWALRGVTVAAVLLLFSFSLHVAMQASYDRSDDTPEMLVYAGVSYDVPAAVAEIERISKQTGEGKDMHIGVDSPFTWPWYWYLRDYRHVGYSSLAVIDETPNARVLVVETGHLSAIEPYLDSYEEGPSFRDLLWFPEEYRDFDLGWWWRYFLNRSTDGPYWSTEGVVYYRVAAP
ncbi:MAG: flippase activity-associated protein Agl23 [Chloroflexota bacterium]